MLFGGAGADDIGVGTWVTGTGAQIAFSALSDSTVSNIDEISGEYISGSEVAILLTGAISGATTGEFNGSNLYVSAGIATGDSFSAGSIGSAASLMDVSLNESGQYVIFTQSGSNYLFVQGGASGTSDDLVLEFNSGVAISGASGLTVKDSGTKIVLDYEDSL